MVLPVYNPIKGTSRITIIYKKWDKFFSNAGISWVSHTCICMCPALSKSTNLLNCIINSNFASYWFVLNFSVLTSRVLTLAEWWNVFNPSRGRCIPVEASLVYRGRPGFRETLLGKAKATNQTKNTGKPKLNQTTKIKTQT